MTNETIQLITNDEEELKVLIEWFKTRFNTTDKRRINKFIKAIYKKSPPILKINVRRFKEK